jgi:hypothetical protein
VSIKKGKLLLVVNELDIKAKSYPLDSFERETLRNANDHLAKL